MGDHVLDSEARKDRDHRRPGRQGWGLEEARGLQGGCIERTVNFSSAAKVTKTIKVT